MKWNLKAAGFIANVFYSICLKVFAGGSLEWRLRTGAFPFLIDPQSFCDASQQTAACTMQRVWGSQQVEEQREGRRGRAAADAIAAIVAADVVVVVAAAALATSTPNNNTIHYAAAGPLVTHSAADTLTHPSRAKPGAVCSVMAGPAPPLGPGQPGAKSASVNVCVCVCAGLACTCCPT